MNSSPLIFLTEVGLLEVLRQPGVPVLVPDAVLVEIGRLGPNDPAIQAVQQSGWMQIVPTPAIPDVVLVGDLDAGESAVLAVALDHPDSMAVLDDQPARRCADAGSSPRDRPKWGLQRTMAQRVKLRHLQEFADDPVSEHRLLRFRESASHPAAGRGCS